jgi:DNA-binding transcriptional LysR family regulator
MDFNQLRSFLEVARQGHLTRAAETLHLSQPAVSGQIKALEEFIGMPLFVRSPSGMSLTSQGRVLLPHAERAIAALQAFRQAGTQLRGQIAGKLILGTVLDPASLRVGELLARALERHPQLELELRHVVSHEAMEGVRSGELDASFYFGDRPADDIVSIPLRDIRYRVCAPAAWAEVLQSTTWEGLAARPWIVAPPTSSHRQLVLQVFARRTPLPDRLIEADNESVIANLIQSGVGISVLRDEIAQPLLDEDRIAAWPGAEIITRLWLTFAASRRDDPLLRALAELVVDLWALEWPATDAGEDGAGDERDGAGDDDNAGVATKQDTPRALASAGAGIASLPALRERSAMPPTFVGAGRRSGPRRQGT